MAKEAPFNGPYDADRQMFTRLNVGLNLDVAIMWRRLAEEGKMGRIPEGPPVGDLAIQATLQGKGGIANKREHKIRQHLAANGDY